MSDDFWNDMDDYHAYISTCGDDSGGGGSNGGGSGSSSGCLPWILGVLAFLLIIGKLFS